MSDGNEFRKNLTFEEFVEAQELYEKVAGKYWLPLHVPEQVLWIKAFEEAKEMFKGK